ncbi:hypothetical protein ACFLZ6_02190 [Nanoarchaeota archaeon]
MDGNDISQETIKQLFYQQIRNLSVSNSKSFDMQFSDRWTSI